VAVVSPHGTGEPTSHAIERSAELSKESATNRFGRECVRGHGGKREGSTLGDPGKLGKRSNSFRVRVGKVQLDVRAAVECNRNGQTASGGIEREHEPGPAAPTDPTGESHGIAFGSRALDSEPGKRAGLAYRCDLERAVEPPSPFLLRYHLPERLVMQGDYQPREVR
jgi:hypothetical protein